MKIRKQQKLTWGISLLLLFGSVILMLQSNILQAENPIEERTDLGINVYSTTGIVVNDSTIASYSSSGSGAIDDPYIIDNLYINSTTDYAVRFNGVSPGVFYVLRDSHLIGTTYGVYIHDITYGEAKVINCTIEGGLGIGGSNAHFLTIKDSTLIYRSQAPNFRDGITFQNNDVYYTGSWSGSVMSIQDDGNIVENNNFYGNYSTFRVNRVTNSSIRNNNLYNTGFYFYTDDVANIVTNDIEGNFINGKSFGYYVNRNNEAINAENNAQVYIVNSTNIIIENLYSDHLNMGLQIHNCTNITVKEAHVLGDDGIDVADSKEILIEHSNLDVFNDGISLDEVEDLTLLDNHIRGASYGIDGEYVDGLNLYNNTIIESTEFGIYLIDSSEIKMTFNVISCEVETPISEIPLYFYGNENMTVYYNVFICYGELDAIPVYEDTCINSIWYDVTAEVGNHYSDWNGSNEYTIYGDGSKDIYPMLDFDKDTIEEFDEVVIYFTNPFSDDSDSDGLGDYEEIFDYGTDPNDEDSDDDGYTDLEEIEAGFDPLDSSDHPLSFSVAGLVIGLILGTAALAAVVFIFLDKKGIYTLPFFKKE